MSASSVDLRPRKARGGASASGAADVSQWNEPSSETRPLPFMVAPPLVAAPAAAEATSGSGIVLQACGDLVEIEPEWRAFERQADHSVFQSFDWLATWQRHIGSRQGTIPAIVLGRDGDGAILFIVPFAIETRGTVRRLTWLAAELCDYNAPLLARRFSDRVSAGHFEPVWHDVVKLLRADRRFRFDLIDLQKMPEAVGGQRNPLLDLEVLVHASAAHIADLGGDWDTFYSAKRSSATRKRERRQLKQLAEHGDVRFIDEGDRDELAQTMATLIRQKSHAFARMGVEDFLARPGYREFFLAAATDPRMRDLIHVSRLEVGTIPAATGLGLKFRGCYYLILSSYEDGELSRLGPGRAHLQALLRHAIDCGLRHFDFTVGDEAYKRDWCDREQRLYDHLAAASLRGAMVVALTTAFRRTKRFIKQSPRLWPMFSKARALVWRFRSPHHSCGESEMRTSEPKLH
jgi:CelD/BcsL family acetyltransferase involved in cellulose biosynthesis